MMNKKTFKQSLEAKNYSYVIYVYILHIVLNKPQPTKKQTYAQNRQESNKHRLETLEIKPYSPDQCIYTTSI